MTKLNPSNIHADHRQRLKEKFVKNGLEPFADHEMLELLLFFAKPLQDTNPLAHRLMKEFSSLSNVFDASYEKLLTIPGIKEHTATLIKLVPAIMQIANLRKLKNIKKLTNQQSAKEFVANIYKTMDHEEFYVICLGPNGDVIDYKKLSTGDTSKVDIQIRAVTGYVLMNNCERVIIAHNHPHSSPEPSDDDMTMTYKLFHSCVLNDIDVLDHIIYSPENCFSFAENAYIQSIKENVFHALKVDPKSLRYRKLATSTANYQII